VPRRAGRDLERVTWPPRPEPPPRVQCDFCGRVGLSRFDPRRAFPRGWAATRVRGRHVCIRCASKLGFRRARSSNREGRPDRGERSDRRARVRRRPRRRTGPRTQPPVCRVPTDYPTSRCCSGEAEGSYPRAARGKASAASRFEYLAPGPGAAQRARARNPAHAHKVSQSSPNADASNGSLGCSRSRKQVM
jgi:hypothetical protein